MKVLIFALLLAISYAQTEEGVGLLGFELPDFGSDLKDLSLKMLDKAKDYVEMAKEFTDLNNRHPDRPDPNTHIFGLDGCSATEIPKQITEDEKPALEMFYTLRLKDHQEWIKYTDDKIFIRFGQTLTGWYERNSVISEDNDAGVFEHYFFPVPIAAFPNVNVASSESLMSLNELGNDDTANGLSPKQKAEMAVLKMGHDKINSEKYHDVGKPRRILTNMNMIMGMAPLQFLELSYDRPQLEDVRSNPLLREESEFVKHREGLTEKVSEVGFPFKDGQYFKTDTNCFHVEALDLCEKGEGPNQNCNQEFQEPGKNMHWFSLPRDRESVLSKGQTNYMTSKFSNLFARSYWHINLEKDTLEIVIKAFSMGLVDGKEYPKKATYWQAAPVTEEDGRENTKAPFHANVNLMKPFCHIPETLPKIPDDPFFFWEPMSVVCPPERLAELAPKFDQYKFPSLVKGKRTNPIIIYRAFAMIAVGSNYTGCASRFLQSSVPYSHGFNFALASAYNHFMTEIHPNYAIDYLAMPTLNTFNINYIYGQDDPKDHCLDHFDDCEKCLSNTECYFYKDNGGCQKPQYTLWPLFKKKSDHCGDETSVGDAFDPISDMKTAADAFKFMEALRDQSEKIRKARAFEKDASQIQVLTNDLRDVLTYFHNAVSKYQLLLKEESSHSCDGDIAIPRSNDWASCWHTDMGTCDEGESCCCDAGYMHDSEGNCHACEEEEESVSFNTDDIASADKYQQSYALLQNPRQLTSNAFALVGVASIIYFISNKIMSKKKYSAITSQVDEI